MKRKAIATAFLLLFLLSILSGCAAKPSDSSKPQKDSTAVTQPDTTEQTDQKLLMLHNEIGENGYSAGMAFIGFVGAEATENELRSYLKNSQYATKYDFLCDAPVVNAGGTELYAVVTATNECHAFVYRAEMTESGEYDVNTDNAYYDGKGMDCFLLRCNESDIHSNAVVYFKNGDEIFSVFPMLSGMDGRLVAENCYDFSVYPDDSGIQDDVMIAYGLLLEAEEVRYYTDLGMSLQYTGQTQIIDGRPCWIFALGTDHDGQFVRELYYGVCDNLIYSYDAVNDAWSVLGAELQGNQ